VGTERAIGTDPFGLVGKTIAARFRVERLVAEGGFGVVYRAEQLALHRAVALKVLKLPGDLGRGQKLASDRTFEEEARIGAALKHPHIVEIYDFGVAEQPPGTALHWMALEWLEGRSLEAVLKARRAQSAPRMEPAQVLELLRPVISAVGYAHRERVVHRDLKPGNIFVVETHGMTIPKVLDFGISKLMAEPDEDGGDAGIKTTRGPPAFSPDYAAPEQVSYGKTGPWTDVHALGLIATEMLTGQQPYAGVGLEERFGAIMSPHRPTPASKGVVVPAWEPVLAKALARRPAERYEDASELLVELEARVSAKPVRLRLSRRGLAWITGGLLVVVVGIWTSIAWFQTRGPSPSRRVMMAVLPFENLTGDPQQDYFSDGLTEGMIGQLGRMQPDRLAVIARTSVAQYKGSKKSVKEIGRELGVQYVLECSVQRAGNRVHIEARLISADDQVQLWSDSYEHELQDVLVMEGEVARDIASEVRLKLTPQQLNGLSRSRSLEPAAFDAYLRGRHLIGEANFAQAAAHLERAVHLDPGFAAAYAALAALYERRLTTQPSRSEASVVQTKAAALRALELDEHLAAAHAALATILFGHQWDWNGAAGHFRRALELDPNDADANLQYCLYLRSLGRREESLAACKSAVELNPFDWNSNMALCSGYYNTHRTEDAIRQCQRTVELSGTDASRGWAYMRLALIHADSGSDAQALTEASKSRDAWVTGYVHARAHRPAEALAVVEQMKRDGAAAMWLGIVYTALNRPDDAFLWLEKAYQQREYGLVGLREQIWWDPVRNDPRFESLIRRIGIPGS
jgi:eukaryotic-like serine/threonine-protein kinase